MNSFSFETIENMSEDQILYLNILKVDGDNAAKICYRNPFEYRLSRCVLLTDFCKLY